MFLLILGDKRASVLAYHANRRRNRKKIEDATEARVIVLIIVCGNIGIWKGIEH